MSIQVLFFASLRERMGISTRQVNPAEASSVAEIWALATEGVDMPDNVLMAINQDYVKADAIAKDGDEVAFFPPVTGG